LFAACRGYDHVEIARTLLQPASIAILRARAAWMYSTAGMNRAVRNVFGQS